MHHSRGLAPGETHAEHPNSEEGQTETTSLTPAGSKVEMQDRTSPRWALILSAFFTIGRLTFLFAVPVLGVFFVTVVAQGGEIGMLPILVLLGVTFMVSVFVLEFAHTRALAGFRSLRESYANKTAAVVAVVVFILLTTIHPLAGLAIPASAAVSTLGYFILAQRKQREPMWDFLSSEAPAVLSGRDKIGLNLTRRKPDTHALSMAMHVITQGISAVFGLALASYLTATGVLAPAAIIPMALVTLWAVGGIEQFVQDYFKNPDAVVSTATEVRNVVEEEEPKHLGLHVQRLSVVDQFGTPLLTNVDLDLEPGTVTGIMGESGSGKSLLLQSIIDPFSMSGSEITGRVKISGIDLWDRSSGLQTVPAVYMPEQPVLLPASGAENLTCFQADQALERGKQILEQLAFSTDIAEKICAHPNAMQLPNTQMRLLALARAFFIQPQLYLMDRPEDGLPEKQIKAVIGRMRQETRLGRSFLIVSSNRFLLNACDKIIVMLDGQVVDYGDAEGIRARMSSGWSRFIGTRELATEANLTRWVHSHFQRGLEKVNKRRVSLVASEMLTLSCQKAASVSPGNVRFMFKHFRGYCVLRMEDDDAPITSSQLALARQQAEDKALTSPKTPLAAILEQTLEQDISANTESRILEVKIKTFDPRKGPTGSDDETDQNA